MHNDWDISTETHGKNKVMKIKKENKEFVFDRKVSRNSNGGYLMAIKIQKENQKKLKTKAQRKSMLLQKKGTKIDINI